MLTGPGGDFQILQQAMADTDDWGLAQEITWYHELNNDVMVVTIKIEQYQHDLDAMRAQLAFCESRLMLAHAAEWVATLQNMPQKLGPVRSGWRRGSCAMHQVHICTPPLDDE
jgi:hypothetical protein